MPREVVKDRTDCYVYRHVRLDKNEPFYIGVGTGRNYKRARKRGTQRNQIWNRIVAKTPYEIDILMDNLTWEQACEKEIEFIKLYGRKDLGTGPLINLTEGGDGRFGHTVSEETRKKMSASIKKAMANVVQSEQQRIATGNTFRRLNKDPEFRKKCLEAARKSAHKIAAKLSKKVVQLTMSGEVVKVWDSGHQVERETDFSRTAIAHCCKGKYKQYRGYKWQYFNNQ